MTVGEGIMLGWAETATPSLNTQTNQNSRLPRERDVRWVLEQGNNVFVLAHPQRSFLSRQESMCEVVIFSRSQALPGNAYRRWIQLI